MAQKVRVDLVDDIDGTAATHTVSFVMDGVTYEIDLSDTNAGSLRDEFAPYIAAARRTGGRKTRGTAAVSSAPTVADREHTRAVRTWARENGWAISDRGRIPAEVIAAYDTAQQEPTTTRPRTRRKK